MQVKAGQNQLEADLSEVQAGIYFVKATVNGRSYVSKLVVK